MCIVFPRCVPHRWVPTWGPSYWWNLLGVPAGPKVRSLASSPYIKLAPPSCSRPTASSSPSATPAPWRWTAGPATSELSWWAKAEPELELKPGSGGAKGQQLSGATVQDPEGRFQTGRSYSFSRLKWARRSLLLTGNQYGSVVAARPHFLLLNWKRGWILEALPGREEVWQWGYTRLKGCFSKRHCPRQALYSCSLWLDFFFLVKIL